MTSNTQTLLKITLGSHFFRITKISPRAREAIMSFAKKYVKFSFTKLPNGRVVRVPSAVFGAATKDREEFRFHINQLPLFKKTLQLFFIYDHLIDYEVLPIPVGADVDLPFAPGYEPRDQQKDIINGILTNKGSPSNFVGLQTGKGKGFVSSYSISKLRKRIAIVVRPMYMYKWVEDIKKYLMIPEESILTVAGSKELKALLMMADQNMLDGISVIIISNKTMQRWFDLYEDYREKSLDLGYADVPENFFAKINAGVRLVDEAHLDFHLNFKLDLYTNIEKAIALTATLVDKDTFMEEMYDIAYPKESRLNGGPLHKYAHAYAVCYNLKEDRKVRTKDFRSGNYSHSSFESSIMSKPDFLESYLKVFHRIVQIGFMDDYKPGERCIIFCYSKEMCTHVVKKLSSIYPKLDIRRFVSEDPEENIYEPDICVSTLGSGGTAHDIQGLKTCIMSNAVDSLKSNIQALGRLREIPGLEVRFYYFVCNSVPKHVEYHKAKLQLLSSRAASVKELCLDFAV